MVDIAQIAPDHRLNKLVMVNLLHIGKGAHIAPILKYGDGIAQRKYLLHAVRHVQNGAAFLPQLADHAEQVFDFTRGKRTGGFIKGNNPGVTRQRLGNFNHLPLADGEIFQRRLGIDIQTKMFKLQPRFIIK